MGYPKRKPGGKFKDRSNGRPDLFEATCSSCKDSCKVPFKPTGSKPIFCSKCFERQGGKAPTTHRRGGAKSFGGDKPLHKATCDKCGRDCEVPFKPTKDKDVYCSKCFKKDGASKHVEEMNTKLDEINQKLDKILSSL